MKINDVFDHSTSKAYSAAYTKYKFSFISTQSTETADLIISHFNENSEFLSQLLGNYIVNENLYLVQQRNRL